MKISIFISPAAIGIIAASSLLLTACSHGELAESKHKNDSLIAVINERESNINNFISSFNEVESSLDSVSAKQQIIHLSADKSHGEFKPSQKDRINEEIAAINNMMDLNRKTIAELTNKLKKSTNKNVQLEKTIATLNKQLTQKYLELTTLNDQLDLANLQVTKLQTSLDTLTAQDNDKAQTISEKNMALHTAYYVIGKSKELQDAKLIDKQGGLLGIGRTSKLSSNFDNNKFIRIDYTKTNNIAINSNNVKIITSHPDDSYTLNKDTNDTKLITSLMITNPEKFWSVSKYLVIVNN